MEFYGDYHTHTRNSDGRQSEEDIIKAAEQQGLKEVAITDHGPLAAVIGVKNAEEYIKLKEKLDEINAADDKTTPRVLVGAEANIRDMKGTLDVPPHIIEELDLLIAGMHPYTLPSSIQDGLDIFVQNSLRHLGKAQREKAVNANTKASIEAIYNNPQLDILSHPGLFFKVDIREVALACVKKQVLFEINCGHKHPDISDIMEADIVGVDFIVNSDAHFPDSVGKLAYGKQLIDELEIEQDRVVNLACQGGYSRWGKKDRDYIFS